MLHLHIHVHALSFDACIFTCRQHIQEYTKGKHGEIKKCTKKTHVHVISLIDDSNL